MNYMYLTLQNPKTRIQNALKVGWSAILFIALWLGISLSVWAQPQYNFTAVGGTFTPITGGATAGIDADDRLSAALPIGFTFVYDGVAYTQFKASSNGFLTFRTAATSSANGNDLDFSGFNNVYPALAPLWDDTDGGFGGTPAPVATYKTEGTTGSQIFTMEWLNWGWNWQANVPVMSFQVKLYEATGVIEYIYKQEPGAINSGGASIGLTTANNAGVGFISLSDASATPTTSTTTETTNISTKPAEGQIYRWSPTFTPVRTLSPADDATAVALDANLSIGFAYPATPPTIGTGNIELRKTTGDVLVESFTLPSARVTVSGNNVVINPTNSLECNTEYYVNVPATAIGGVGFTGVTTTTDWSFTTTAPVLAGYSYTTIPVSFETIATTGTAVTGFTGGDGISTAAITMPTAFPYFGNTYTQLKIGADGWITLDATQTGGDFSNSTIPSTDGPPLMIAPFWDDLDASSTGTVAYQDMGTYFLVSFENVEAFFESTTNSFQVKLFYATGVIEFHYGTFNTTTLDEATVGIENATETDGLLINFNGTGDALGSDRAFRISPPPTSLPLTATFTPTNGATNVIQNSDLVLNFPYPVSAGTGNIEIVNATTNAVLETIPVGDARVDYSTIGQVTIDPANDFSVGAEIAVRFPTGAFKSCNNIDVAGITNTTDWRFTVGDPCATFTVDAGANQFNVVSGSDITFSGSTTGGTGPYTYAWTPAAGLTGANTLTPTFTGITATTTFTLTVTDTGTGCVKADGVTISVAFVGGGGGGGTPSTVRAPSLRLTSTGSTTMTLDWDSGIAEQYAIFRRGGSSSNFIRLGEVSSAVETFLDVDLMPNTRYSYYVQALSNGSVASSNVVSDYTYPSAPIIESFQNACVGTGAQLNVKGSTGIYRVYSTETGGAAVTTGDSTATITTPTFADSTATFYVSAVGSRYESTPRVAVSVITRPLPTATMLGDALQESCTDSLTIMAEAVDGATYTWYSSDVPVATTSTPMYTVNRGGVYSVLVNKDGCVARSNTIRVRVNRTSPAQITGFATREFCEVGTLNATQTEGASYEWQRDNTVVGTGSSLEVTQSGSYRVTVTSSLGCVLTSTPVAVTVINVPQVDLQSSAPDFCEGTDGVELTVNSVSGASYEWLRNGRRVRTTSTPSLQVNVAGEYRVRAVLNGICSRTSDPVTVTRNAAPAASARIYGDSIKVVYVGNVAITSVTWTKDSTAFSATTQAFAPTESGLYVATVTYETGCQVVSSGTQYIKPPETPVVVGEEDVEALGFMLFPNPTASKVNLSFGDAFKGDITLTLTDAIGRTIQVVKVKASENATLDLSKVANGNYMLTIASDNKVVTRKIIRE